MLGEIWLERKWTQNKGGKKEKSKEIRVFSKRKLSICESNNIDLI